MKVEVEIDDNIYARLKELMPDVDLGKMLGRLWEVQLLLMATHPEEFTAVFGGTPTPEQRQMVEEYMRRQALKVLKESKREEERLQ